MSKLFLNNVNTVGVVENAGILGAVSVFAADTKFQWLPTSCIITQVGLSHKCNIQLQPTLSRSIYVYDFGDSPGTMKISGLAFRQACEGQQVEGFTELLTFYARSRISASFREGSTRQVQVIMGGQTFIGYLVGMDSNLVSSEGIVYSWSMNIIVVPDFTSLERQQSGIPVELMDVIA